MKRTKMAMLKLGDEKPVNPIDGVWVFPSYGNLSVVDTGSGLVVIDLPVPFLFDRAWSAMRAVLSGPVKTIFVTHGHGDHAISIGPVLKEAEEKKWPRPTVIAHRNVLARFRRYRMLAGFNDHINRIQFSVPDGIPAFPLPEYNPDVLFDQSISTCVGSLDFHAYHAKGETDDHLWVWVPEKKAVFAGDMVIWSFPNVGNPLEVQRFTLEWAEALEQIVGKAPEILVPAHGPVLKGAAEIRRVCLTISSALRYLHDEVVKRLNQGQSYHEILHGIQPLKEWDAHDFLTPRYGHPTFVIHGILRQYTGWYDGNPTHLFPSREEEVHAELAQLIGLDKLAGHIDDLMAAGNFQLALHLLDVALDSDCEPEKKKALHLQKATALEALAESVDSFIVGNLYYNGYNREMRAAGLDPDKTPESKDRRSRE